MKLSLVFVISFGVIAFIYAFLAAFSTIFYRGKSTVDLSHLEHKILNKTATLGDRIKTFFANLFASYASPPIYITSGLITFIFWIVISIVSPKNNQKNNLPISSIIEKDTIEYIYFKDSTKVPKNLFLVPFIESVRQQNGDLINAEEYSACIIDKLTQYFTAAEFVSFFKNKDNIRSGFNFFSTEFGKKVSLECLPDNINLNSKVNYPSSFKSETQKQFQIEIQKDPKFNNMVSINKFCECLVDKIMRVYTYPEYLKLNVEEELLKNPKFLQARDECLKESLIN